MSATEDLLRWDAEHIVHSLYPIGQNRGVMFKRAQGKTLEDFDGRQYLDFSSQLDCVNLGYGRQELVEAAAQAMQETSFLTTFFGLSNQASIECGMALAKLTPPGLDHFFFTAGGSESNESAFMISRRYWQNSGKPTKYKILSQYGCYHGATFAARSCTNMGCGGLDMGLVQTLPGFLHVPYFYCYRCMLGQHYPECGIKCVDYIADVIEREGRDNVAAFIAEPVMGAPGMVPSAPEYWPKIRKVCDEHEVLLIADEVMTGFFRTGKPFAVEHWNVEPDLMTMAKGITSAYFPVGVLAFNERVYEVMKGQVEEGHTYSGHPVGMAIAVKAMEIYEREKIAEHVTEVSAHLFQRLREEFLPLPCVGDISGLGFMGAIEIVADKESKRTFDRSLNVMERVKAEALEQGLFMRVAVIEEGLGDRAVWSPPLILTTEDIDRALDILKPILAGVKPA
jgi:putrescine aminotransferase